MKKLLFLPILLLFFGCANLAQSENIILNKNLVKVDENHHETIINDNKIVLDSYIVMFEVPYYIVLKSEKPLSLQEAESIATEYIKPRGCTAPLQRRTDLDKSNSNKTQWLIGIEC